jgi:hypothetical protein
VRKYAQEPFALLGVNADASREQLRRTQEKEQLPWRSWWDGPDGPISAAWGVDRFPTAYLLDPRGEVRFRHVGVAEPGAVEAEVDRLLGELHQAGKKGKT